MNDRIAPMHASEGVPEGFVPLAALGQFVSVNGPIFMRSSDRVLGFKVGPAHCNPMGVCHGGWLATFLDMQLPASARRSDSLPEGFPVTVSLSLDYLSPVQLGSWVQGEATILDRKGSLIFAQGLAKVGGAIAVRGSGVYKLVRAPEKHGL